MRQITFELLRHGPPHNQLLSPLTQYLALCENHAAVTLQLPFEHNQFLHRHRALSYQVGDEARSFQVKDTARVLGDVLGGVPGLIAELNRGPQDVLRVNRQRDPSASQRLTHLRVVISASELALLPFELALTPGGFPGAGQPLLLQSQEPICLTREVRRVPEDDFPWPEEPRVLFAAAAPRDVGPVPFEDHLRILRRILEPWVRYAENEEGATQRLAEHLVVLPEATPEAIERACAEGRFSHVHILAHGFQYQDGFDVRFGLALHDARDPKGNADVVSGDRLATILRAAQTPGNETLARPLAVTLASCDTANVGTVAGAGASVAHALHTAGIPMVVASQFPISSAGSQLLVEVLYSGFLWGTDPRLSINDLRRRLHSRYPSTHDWASVTAYLSLPSTFERRLADLQISQTMRSIEVAMNFADRATARLMKRPGRTPEPEATLTDEKKAALLESARTRIEAGKVRLERLLESGRDKKARIYGLLASTEKRYAEVHFSFSRVPGKPPGQDLTAEWQNLLEKARQHYWEAFLHDRDSSWGVVQYLSLDLLLRNLKNPTPELRFEPHDEHNRPEALWNVAHVLSINDLRSGDERRVQWALGNLTELYLLALGLPQVLLAEKPQALQQRAVQRAKDLVDLAGPDSFEVYSTRRQLLRYADWYSEIASIPAIQEAVEPVLEVLPVSRRHARE